MLEEAQGGRRVGLHTKKGLDCTIDRSIDRLEIWDAGVKGKENMYDQRMRGMGLCIYALSGEGGVER